MKTLLVVVAINAVLILVVLTWFAKFASNSYELNAINLPSESGFPPSDWDNGQIRDNPLFTIPDPSVLEPDEPPAPFDPADIVGGPLDQNFESLRLDDYIAKLEVTKKMEIPGKTGVLSVWIGHPFYEPTTTEGRVSAVGSIAALGQTAQIDPYAPDFELDPEHGICMKLHKTGSYAIFAMTPTQTGTFYVSATVNLFDSDDCSGPPVPKATRTLEVSVDVNFVAVAKDYAKDLWEVFWEKFLEFWGLVLAICSGLVLFLFRKKILKVFGYSGPE